MARGIALSVCLTELKNEIRQATTAGTNTADDARLKNLLDRTQDWLALEHDWEFLRKTADVAITADTQYFSFPATLQTEGIREVWFKEDTLWHPLAYGISVEDLNLYDSDAGDSADIPERWQFNSDEAAQRIELWPIPAGAGTLRIVGIKPLPAFSADSDISTLDEWLLVLFAAAEELSEAKHGQAQAKLALAQGYLQKLKAKSSRPSSTFILGGGNRRGPSRLPFRTVGPSISIDSTVITIDNG